MKSPTTLILELRQMLADRGWTFDTAHFKESNVSWYAWLLKFGLYGVETG